MKGENIRAKTKFIWMLSNIVSISDQYISLVVNNGPLFESIKDHFNSNYPDAKLDLSLKH